MTGKLDDPAWRVERARKGGLARTTTDAHIDALVASVPVLTDEQAAKLRPLLPEPHAPEGGGQE